MVETSSNLLPNGQFEDGTTGWTIDPVYNSSITTSSGTKYLTCTVASTSASAVEDKFTKVEVDLTSITPGVDRVLFFVVRSSYYANDSSVSLTGRVHWTHPDSSPAGDAEIYSNSKGYFYGQFHTYQSGTDRVLKELQFGLSNANHKNDYFKLSNCFVVDLTDMFGAGNEPPTDWCVGMFSISESTFSLSEYVPPVDAASVDYTYNSIVLTFITPVGADSVGYTVNDSSVERATVITSPYSFPTVYQDAKYTIRLFSKLDGVYNKLEPKVFEFTTPSIPKSDAEEKRLYKLLRLLQRHFQCEEKADRYVFKYYFEFIFHNPNVVLTDAGLAGFRALIDKWVAYWAEIGLVNLGELEKTDRFDELVTDLSTAFSEIDVRFSYASTTHSVTFNLPNWKYITISGAYFCKDIIDYATDTGVAVVNILSRVSVRSDYWEDASEVYSLENDPDLKLSQLNMCQCGENATFHVDGETLTIGGSGALVGMTTITAVDTVYNMWEKIWGLGWNPIVIGADIDGFPDNCFTAVNTLGNTFVYLRPSSGSVTFGSGDWIAPGASRSYPVTIYTDNLAMRAKTFTSPYISVTFKPLSEWDGS